MARLTLTAEIERWPIAGAFTISRGSKREAIVVVVTAQRGGHLGRGEAVPYPRYGETPEQALADIEAAAPLIRDRASLSAALPPGAARNAVDCALWDLEAREAGLTVADLSGLGAPEAVPASITISLDAPDAMAAAARARPAFGLLKLKLGGGIEDHARLRAVRAARPDARLIADANEAWRPETLAAGLAVAAEVGCEMVEQPLPADEDRVLAGLQRAVPVCADESAHTSAGLADLVGRYDAVNIKLDKTGGLTEAIVMTKRARVLGLRVMLGCMVATSLSMAPAFLLAREADWVDLDGPLLLAADRPGGLRLEGGRLAPPSASLWG